MKIIEMVVKSDCGLHARPASDFTKKTKKYKCKITVSKDDRQANAKSIIDVLSLSVHCGETISICFEGQDEELAAKEMAEFSF
ncbi:MAG: HPr family phosphocarrier protein [Anaerolineaceae bacterium]|nr:HPr family phosphocarrier protein [Anaerolineaceae bacterium]